MEKNFIKVRSVKDIVIFTSIIVLGCVLAIAPFGAGAAIAGYMLVILGFLMCLMMKSEYKEASSGERFAKKELFFPREEKQQLMPAVTSSPYSMSLAQEGKGQAIRLDVFYSKKLGKFYIQMFEYIPYQYEKCTGIVEYNIKK